jgi:hypothetical protein
MKSGCHMTYVEYIICYVLYAFHSVVQSGVSVYPIR